MMPSSTNPAITIRAENRFRQPVMDLNLRQRFPTAEVGDEVVEHRDDCIREADDDGYCSCDYTLWRLTDTGWHDPDDPGADR